MTFLYGKKVSTVRDGLNIQVRAWAHDKTVTCSGFALQDSIAGAIRNLGHSQRMLTYEQHSE